MTLTKKQIEANSTDRKMIFRIAKLLASIRNMSFVEDREGKQVRVIPETQWKELNVFVHRRYDKLKKDLKGTTPL